MNLDPILSARGRASARLLEIGAATLVLGAALGMQSQFAFPSGGDPGHLVAQARGVDGGLTKTPPLVPLLAGVLHLLSGGHFPALSLFMKVFAVGSHLLLAFSLRSLTGALTADPWAPRLAFVLALINPMALYQILWGGLAQFWGMAMAMLCVTHLLRWHEGPTHRWGAMLAFMATLYAHWYTATFLIVAATTLAVSLRIWRGMRPRQWLALAAAGAIAAVPLAWIYLNIVQDLRPFSETRAILTTSYFPGFWRLFSERVMLTLSAAALLGLATVLWSMWRWPPGATVRRVRILALVFGAGFLALLAGTPATLAGRAYYFLPLLIIPLEAILIAGHACRAKTRAVAGAATAMMLIMAGSGLAAYHSDQPFFNPMGKDSAEAFVAIRETASAQTVVYSSFPNVDAWWLEAVTGRETVATDVARYYTKSSELGGMDAGLRAAWGEASLDLGGAAVAVSPERGTPWPVTVLVRNEGNPIPVIGLDEPASSIVWRDGARTPLRTPTTHGVAWFVDGLYHETWTTERGNVTRSIYAEAGRLTVRYDVDPPAIAVSLHVEPGKDGHFIPPARPRGALAHWWNRDSIRTPISLDPSPVQLRSEDAVLHLPLDADGARFRLRVSDPLDEPVRLVPAAALLSALRVEMVYLRDVEPVLYDRFAGDPSFTLDLRRGDVAVFRVEGPP